MAKGDLLGWDTYVGPVPGGGIDMLPDGRGATGLELVRNGMVARSMADTIPMTGAPGGVREFGRDVRKWIGSPLTDAIAATRAAELAIVYGRDPRVDKGSVAVQVSKTLAGAQYDFGIAVTARTVTGQPISMILGITAVTVDLLAQQGA